MNKRKLASMEIWNKDFYVGAVLSFIDSIVSRHSVMEFSRYNRMRYVTGAILENRVQKAYPGGNGTIIVELYFSDTYFEVSIKDKGIPMWDEFSYQKDHLGENHRDFRNYLLDQWTDEVGIENLGKEGQRVYIRQNILNRIQFKAPEPYQETEVLDTNISIRSVETEADAIEAIRCIYSEYGYSYSYERLYYVDSLLNLIRTGEVMSFLAVNDHGQTAGHFALVFSDVYQNMPEISTVVIRKEFRGLGLFSKFIDHCQKTAKDRNCRALMGQPVAFHPMSQKAFLKAGFTATSLLMGYINSDIESVYNKEKQRMDVMASVRILDETACSKIYPPKELYSFIGKIYDRLGWKYEFCDAFRMSDHTGIKIEDNGGMKVKKMLLQEASDDLEEILKDAVQDSLRRKEEMIELLISMNEASCQYAYEIARKCKFVLSGIIPGSENADYLVMQMLVGMDIPYDHLITVGEFEEVKNDVIYLNSKGKELETS